MNDSTLVTIVSVLLLSMIGVAAILGGVLFFRRQPSMASDASDASDAGRTMPQPLRASASANVSGDLLATSGFALQSPEAEPCEVSPAITIYRVAALDTQLPATLKVIAPSALAQDSNSRRKLEQQLAIAQSLTHPNCAQILASNVRADTPYFVEEWLSEGSLQDYLRVGESLAEEDITYLVGQLCDGLAYLHTRKLIHGFVTPGHIRFDADGVSHLIHCGFAQLVGDKANERGQAASASDLYSLGVVAFQMATGHMPFEDSPANAMPSLPKHDPRRFNSTLTSKLADAIRTALNPDREQRFNTARDMARAFGYTRPFFGMQHATTVFTMPQAAAAAAPQHKPSSLRRSATGLLHLFNESTGSLLAVQPPRTIITRDLVNPSDGMISRYNGELVYEKEVWRLSELADAVSANGIFINEQRITTPRILCYGDVVRVGTTVLKVKD